MKSARLIFVVLLFSKLMAVDSLCEVAKGSHPQVLAAIDRLLQLQDATAMGNREAVAAQMDLLRSIARDIDTLDDDTAIRVASAAAAYVLSGGDPATADRLSKSTGMEHRYRRLLEAAALFMRGDRSSAQGLMRNVNPRDYPGRLAGRIALAQALLEKDQIQQDRYALAIALMPGTLVEESALRRSALAYAAIQDEQRFWERWERYNRRFPTSLYAGSFREEAMEAVAKWTDKDHATRLRRLDEMLAMLPLAERRRLYLVLARTAILSGAMALAESAGRRLERMSAEGSREQELGKLYTGLFKLVSPSSDESLGMLRSIKSDDLDLQERALLAAAVSLGKQIVAPATAILPSPVDPPEEQSRLETRGKELLAATQDLLSQDE